jgi:hypothetical protein
MRRKKVNPRDLPIHKKEKFGYWGEPLPKQYIDEDKADINGFIIYEGPSLHDGEPIVVIATGFFTPSSNVKTGDMIQTWILRSDMSPQEAVWRRRDESICGSCTHRGKLITFKKRWMTKKGTLSKTKKTVRKSVGRSCYVVVGQAPAKIYEAYKRGNYPRVTRLEDIEDLFRESYFAPRIGSYGDPAMVPIEIWDAVTRYRTGLASNDFKALKGSGWTGYTAMWPLDRAQPYKNYLMASVPNLSAQKKAREMGWRTFRVGSKSEPPVAGIEIICPATPEMGQRVKCDACSLCMGTSLDASCIVVPPHGTGSKWHELRGEYSEQDIAGMQQEALEINALWEDGYRYQKLANEYKMGKKEMRDRILLWQYFWPDLFEGAT